MGLLLYKSNEMFSSTELIRKSKMIFDKILGRKIEKAIILRDGKPSFLLMEFSKYEKIMAEYEELKEYVEALENADSKPKKPKKKKRELSQKDKELKQTLEEESKHLRLDGGDYSDLKESTPVQIETEKEEVVSVPQESENKNVIKDEPEDTEMQKAIESIDAMDLDEETKEKGREKIRQKILEARKQREQEMQQQEQNLQEEDEEFEEQIQQEKLKKEQELEEFWD